jgi:tryptophanyl-tRNA synthetase
MTYGEVFTIPEPEIEETIAVIPGIDGQKMSKSYDNVIPVFAEEKAIRKRIMSIVTDATPVEAPKDPDNSTIFAIYKLFASPEQSSALAEKFRAGGMGYGDAKKELFELIWNYFAPFRQKRKELENNLDYVKDLRKKGKERAEAIAADTMDKVRRLVGITG